MRSIRHALLRVLPTPAVTGFMPTVMMITMLLKYEQRWNVSFPKKHRHKFEVKFVMSQLWKTTTMTSDMVQPIIQAWCFGQRKDYWALSDTVNAFCAL